jgi:hypothetical protein
MMSKQQASAGRGGYRVNAGRKSSWQHPETQTIRVPKVLAQPLMQLARQLDQREIIASDTLSMQAWTINVTESKQPSLDSVSYSKIPLPAALTQAQTILRAKRSARESLARLLSVLYGTSVSVEDLTRRRPQ